MLATVQLAAGYTAVQWGFLSLFLPQVAAYLQGEEVLVLVKGSPWPRSFYSSVLIALFIIL